VTGPRAGPIPLHIAGLGLALPPRIQENAELEPLLGVPPGWIAAHTGVERRRIAEVDVAELGAEAARGALGDGPPPDLLINASLSPAQLAPDTSVFVARALGLSGVPSFSVHATCLSALVALQQAAALIAAGMAQRVLIVSSEVGSVCRDLRQPESAALIGDGAAAMLVTAPPPGPGPGGALLSFGMRTFPDGAELAQIRGFGRRRLPLDPATRPDDQLFDMQGPALVRRTLPRVRELLPQLLGDAGLTAAELDLVVPHQASGPALRLLSRIGFAEDRVVNIIADHGNCIAASLPMALAIAARDGRLRRGHRVLLIGTGAGLSVAGAVLRW
jgi:3-oxoacyl-[acyl-carrier-protein] synthase-3